MNIWISEDSPYTCTEGFKVSLKRVQRKMIELGICTVTVKKYKHHSNKKVAEGWYNRKKLLSSINYMTPDQCELLARSAA